MFRMFDVSSSKNTICSCSGECGITMHDLTNGATNLTSPGYPNDYPPDILCYWIISVDVDNHIIIRIITLIMENGYDFLTIGNGDEPSDVSAIIYITGATKLTALTSNSSRMWIEMTTDGVVNMDGFMVQLEQLSLDNSEDNNTRGELLISE